MEKLQGGFTGLVLNWYEQKICMLRGLAPINIFSHKYIRWGAGGLLKIFVGAMVFFNRPAAVIFMSPYLIFYIKEQKQKLAELKKRQLNMQFKDAMIAVTFSLNVGYSIENAFKEAVIELRLLYGEQGEIVKAFQDIIRKVERNENIENALYDFAQKSEMEDILYFAEIFRYAKRSGGDLISIIRNTANTIREKVEMENEIQTVISGKKMEQSVMSIMPAAIILYIRLTAPEFIHPLYGSVQGIITMTVCLGIYMAADFWAKRIVQIHV